jgi:predicted AlkP superfamily pyrophosphatase or phosphodiesterase
MVDGMRKDFYRLLECQYLSTSRASLRKLEELTVWALAPTLTCLNVAALWTGTPPSQDQFLGDPPPETGSGAFESGTPSALPGVSIIKLNQLDEQLHASTLGLAQLYDSVMPAVVAPLAQIVEAAHPGRLIAITADHGFVENPEYRPHGSARRYRHGGLDLFEVLVPLAVFQKL